jgi:hypothetical protein
VTETATLAGTTTNFWIRAWVRLGALPVTGNSLELMSADQPSAPRFGDFVFVKRDETDVYSQFDDTVSAIPVPMPTDQWVCLVWHVGRSATTGTLDLSGDVGSTSRSATTDGTPALSVIALGPNFAATNVTAVQPSFDVWLDDVIIHHAAVTCAD